MAKYQAIPNYEYIRPGLLVQFRPDGMYETRDEKEIAALDSAAPFIKLVDTPNIAEPEHVGGGYYLLSNGEKVKGKEAAIEAEAKIKK
ncbi:hypothetical protein AB1K91_17975 [Terribacillus sp. 179-K 1B1 HS]|uniref:hypothetical protein n=1 Tax=Terribacillus sp. 179-K 1B1 HS TaxID=3142388 RepID=UPI0039A19B86